MAMRVDETRAQETITMLNFVLLCCPFAGDVFQQSILIVNQHCVGGQKGFTVKDFNCLYETHGL